MKICKITLYWILFLPLCILLFIFDILYACGESLDTFTHKLEEWAFEV